MMKKIILLASLVTPVTVFSHPGHGIEEQVHGFLHVEHLLALLAIIAAVIITKAIKK